MKRKYKIAGINNAGANDSALKVIETNISADKGYFVAGDICTITPEGIVAMVIDIGVANDNETIAVKKTNGTNWTAADITTSSKISHEWYPLY